MMMRENRGSLRWNPACLVHAFEREIQGRKGSDPCGQKRPCFIPNVLYASLRFGCIHKAPSRIVGTRVVKQSPYDAHLQKDGTKFFCTRKEGVDLESSSCKDGEGNERPVVGRRANLSWKRRMSHCTFG